MPPVHSLLNQLAHTTLRNILRNMPPVHSLLHLLAHTTRIDFSQCKREVIHVTFTAF